MTPGIEGFLAIFVIVVITIFLIRSMVKHLRGIRYRAERSGEVGGAPVLPEEAPRPRPPARRQTAVAGSTGGAAQPMGPAPSPSPPAGAGGEDRGGDGQEQVHRLG